MVRSNAEGPCEAGQVVELVGGIYGGREERVLGEVQVSHARRTCFRYVVKERGYRKTGCSFLNNVSLEPCGEEFDSTVDESDEETEIEENDIGEEAGGAVEVVQRAGGVVENAEAVEVRQGGGASRVVEGVRTVDRRVVEASERDHGSRDGESQARAVRIGGGGFFGLGGILCVLLCCPWRG